MSKIVSLVLAGFVMVIALAAPSQSQAQIHFPTWPGERVTINGCVSRTGLENRCLLIRDITTGMSYQINSAMPKPVAGAFVVRLTGVVTTIFDTCMAGPVLEQIRWRYTQRLCPPIRGAQ